MNLFKVQLNSGFSLCVFCPLCVCWLIDVFLACALTFILKHVLICHHYLPLLFSAPWGINSSPHSCIFLPSTSPLFRILVLTFCFIKKKKSNKHIFLDLLTNLSLIWLIGFTFYWWVFSAMTSLHCKIAKKQKICTL